MTSEKHYAPRTEEKREIWSMKISPKTKYLAAVQARNERRSLSALVESAVESYLQRSGITINGKKHSVIELAGDIWSDERGERFIMLAETFPNLFTPEEEHLWAIIQERELVTPDRCKELEESFANLQREAIERTHAEPTESVSGFPFRAGAIDTSIPSSLVESQSIVPKKGKK